MTTRFLVSTVLLAVGCLAFAAPSASAAPPKDKLVLQAYPVADLVVPTYAMKQLVHKGTAKTDMPAKSLNRELIAFLSSIVSPLSWDELGGPGTILYEPLTRCLVVNQTQDVQEHVAEMLGALRRLQDSEIVFEIQWLSVPENICESFGIDFKTSTDQPRKIDTPQAVKTWKDIVAMPSKEVLLNDVQVFQLLEAVQGDVRTQSTRAPKMTLLRGQTGVLYMTDTRNYEDSFVHPEKSDDKPSLRVAVQDVASVDRRFVRLHLKVDQTDIHDSIVTVQSVEKMVSVPDGGTVLLGGFTKVREVRHEHGLPILSKIPYLNRLFTKVGYDRETHIVFVMVTPRIVSK